MTFADLTPAAALIVLAISTIIVLLTIALQRSHRLAFALTVEGLLLTLVVLAFTAPAASSQVTPLLTVDSLAVFYMALLTLTTLAVALLAYNYLQRLSGRQEEFYVLLLLALVGCFVLVSSSHFASLFLGLEILSVSLYGLVGYTRGRRVSIEASFKYLVLAAASAAILAFGMALIYFDQGAMDFGTLPAALGHGQPSVTLLAGIAMVVVGIGFKLAVVPFHLWTPDVYQGAPAPATAFLATVSKGAVFALLLRFLGPANIVQLGGPLFLIFALIAAASMLAGNLLALRQRNIKRILAYSSIAQLGYLLVAFLAGGARGAEAATFFLVAYFITTVAAFGVIGVLSSAQGDADMLDDYRGLFWRRPWLAAVLTVALFSLAGIPLTGGFIGKFFVISAGAGATLWLLVGTLVVGSAIGLYYYLAIIIVMIRAAEPGQQAAAPAALPLLGGAMLGLLTVALILIGIFPAPLIEAIQAAIL